VVHPDGHDAHVGPLNGLALTWPAPSCAPEHASMPNALWQRRHQRVELGSRDLGLPQAYGPILAHAVQRKDALGKVDSNADNGHDFPFRMS